MLLFSATILFAEEGDSFAEPRPMSAVDFIELPRISTPALSRDGRFLVYGRSEVVWEENKDVDRLRLVEIESGSVESVIAAEEVDEDFDEAVWAGENNGFIVTLERGEDEFDQAYFYNLDDKSLRKLTDHKEDIDDVLWSNNEDGFFFRSPKPYTEEVALDLENDWRIEPFDVDQKEEVWFYDWTSGSSRKLFGGDFDVRDFSQSRDGSKVLFARTDHTYIDRPDAELWSYDIATGSSIRVTTNGFAEQKATLSPDNKLIAFVATVNEHGEQYYEDNVFVQTIGDEKPTLILPDVPMEMLDVRWNQAGDGLYLLGNTGVRTHLYYYDLRADKHVALTTGDREINDWSYDATLDTHTYIDTNARNPGEVMLLPMSGVESQQVTNEYAELESKFQIPQQRVFTWRARGGITLEGILIYPLNYRDGDKFPLVTITHGGPRSSAQFGSWNMSRYVAVLSGQGYGVFLPNHRGGTGYGDKFMRDMVGGYFRHAHLDVLSGIDALVDAGLVDPNQLIKMGWSAGGHMTNKLITLTNRFRAASSGAGASDWVSMYGETDARFNRTYWFGGAPWAKSTRLKNYTKQSMLKDAWRIDTPTLFFVGQKDERVPPTQSILMYRGARAAGVETNLYVAPGEPHNYGKPKNRLFKINTELEWYARHLERVPYNASFPDEKHESPQ